MKNKLLVIDPQNDFCDIPGAALPVPGASADLMRLSHFVAGSAEFIHDLVVTLDTHPQVAIERVSFWQDSAGKIVPVFTQITEQDVREGRYAPRDAAASLKEQVIGYLHALEEAGRYRLIVWPVHCVLGTKGHAIYAPLALHIASWEERTQRATAKVLKGLNPLTEQYSAIAAEVPMESDPTTQRNKGLIERVRPGEGERLLIAGEAASHCVRATVLDLMEAFSAEELARTVLLTDCMSPVGGFETQAEDFYRQAQSAGAHLASSAQMSAIIKEEC